jgi:hypothetical protein
VYGESSNWQQFWHASLERMNILSDYECVAVADITDFYKQIYHHAFENELTATGIPKQAQLTLKHFLGTLTQGVSRGVPVGRMPFTYLLSAR